MDEFGLNMSQKLFQNSANIPVFRDKVRDDGGSQINKSKTNLLATYFNFGYYLSIIPFKFTISTITVQGKEKVVSQSPRTINIVTTCKIQKVKQCNLFHLVYTSKY